MNNSAYFWTITAGLLDDTFSAAQVDDFDKMSVERESELLKYISENSSPKRSF